ncbi:hypothetical protein IH982_02610 [Patescibacteria group bacterium]|nr:hypothetical protein [Patescibacteria group bacterium]
MTPEEKINWHLWWLLQKIKEEYLSTPKGEPVTLELGNTESLVNVKFPSIDRREKLMLKLRELGAIELLGDRRTIYGKTFILKVSQTNFDKLYKEYEQRCKDTAKNEAITFDDATTSLKMGRKKCQLPPFKNEHFFCRELFKYLPNEAVDWSLIYEAITGNQVDSNKQKQQKNRKMVYDVYENLNKRGKELFGIKNWLVWQGKTVKRTQ